MSGRARSILIMAVCIAGFGGAVGERAVSADDTRSLARARAGKQDAEPITDTRVAELGLRLVTGVLHRADFSGGGEPRVELTGSAGAMTDLYRRCEELGRRWFRESNGYTGAEDPMGSPLNFEVCMVEKTRLHGEPEREATPYCARTRRNTWNAEVSSMHNRLATRIFWFDRLVEHVSPEVKALARDTFARTMGWEPVYVREGRTFVLRPVPMEEWPPRVIRQALHYAGDAELRASLERALRVAPTHTCRWTAGTLVQEARGRSFGPPQYDPRLVPRPDVAGSGGEVACDEVPRARSSQSMLRAVRRDHDEPRSVIAVTPVEGQDWVTHRGASGAPTSKTRVVHIWRRVER